MKLQHMQAMLAESLLIRRPLIQHAEQHMAGFDVAVEQRLGLARHVDDLDGCISEVPCVLFLAHLLGRIHSPSGRINPPLQ